MVGPEYPGEGAAKKLTAGSYYKYPEGFIASAHSLGPRKRKMEAWSNDTQTKKIENQEKTGNEILGVLENCSSIGVCQ